MILFGIYFNFMIFEKDQNGFTLIELLLYFSIASLALLAIGSFLVVILNNRLSSASRYSVEQQGSAILEVVLRTIKSAEVVNYPLVGNASSSISLGFVEAEKTPTLFYVDNGFLMMKEGLAEPIRLNDSFIVFSSSSFANFSSANDMDLIKVFFNISYVSSSNQIQEIKYQNNFYGSVNRK